jgi:hypothetical protein
MVVPKRLVTIRAFTDHIRPSSDWNPSNLLMPVQVSGCNLHCQPRQCGPQSAHFVRSSPLILFH